MSDLSPVRAWLFAFALCLAAVLLCIGYVDRPVASYVEANLRHRPAVEAIEPAWKALYIVVVLAFACLFGSGGWVISGRRLAAWAGTSLVFSWSVVWALAATAVLKIAFGRSSAVRYVTSHIHEWRLLHGSSDFESFPSGTISITCAIVAVAWIRFPHLRLWCAAALTAIVVALVVTNSHFVADIIAGAFLGATVGWMTVRLVQPVTA